MQQPDSKRSGLWLWIAIPFVLVIVAVVAFIMWTDPQAGSPFTYSQ